MVHANALDAFHVPLGLHLVSGFVHRRSSWWVRLGDLESLSLRKTIDSTPIDRPVYVCGLARAGTTLLLEFLARRDVVATHRYCDFPGQFTPVWWNRGQPQRSRLPQERAHADRLIVTQDSPEAMEESLWMAFFPEAHRGDSSAVLDNATNCPKFENFYRDHLRKLLLLRGGSRYVSKGNYNITRLLYLQRLFSDVRFVVAIRRPRDHVASLVKQHRLFCAGERRHPRSLAHLQRVGHFEFGLDRRAINVGDGAAKHIVELWQRGEDARGYARQWASIYGWLADALQINERLRAAATIVRYEDLCEHPLDALNGVLEHCELPSSEIDVDFAAGVSLPQYYDAGFTAAEEAAIAEETADVSARFGY